jgi:hypothetical protein
MTDKPVFDLDAVLAEGVAPTPFRFRFGGEDYELPAHVDLRAIAAFDAGRLDDALRLMLGAEQYQRLQRSSAVFDQQAFVALFEAYSEHEGSNLGESPASTDS